MKTLYILGNGFDLAHGLATSYEDFHRWLNHKNSVYAKRFEALYPSVRKDGTKEWNNIESALGDFSIEDVKSFDENYNDCPDDQDNTSKEGYIVGSNIKNVTVILPHLLLEWIATINYPKSQSIERFNKMFKVGDFFITFNYTSTLENMYSVPRDRIYHIHGSILQSDKEFIIGFLPSENEIPSSYDSSDKKNLWNLMMNMQKPIHFCADMMHRDCDSALEYVDRVIVYGHSCSSVDKQYFVEISKTIRMNASWIYYYHTPNAKKHFERFAKDVFNESGCVEQNVEFLNDND